MAIRAVITSDIVNSTQISKILEKKIYQKLNLLLKPYVFEFYRGDSFQAFLQDPNNALRVTLLCRTAAIGLAEDGEAIPDIRSSIGIGETPATIKKISTANGEAFLLSGRNFDAMKPDTRLEINTTNTLANEGLGVISMYIDALFRNLTNKQAQVIFELLNGETQQAIAKRFKRTKSTINQHAAAGRWNEIERLLTRYEKIIAHL